MNFENTSVVADPLGEITFVLSWYQWVVLWLEQRIWMTKIHWQPLFEPHLCILSIFLFPSKCFLRFFHDLTGPSHYVPRLPSQRPGKQCPLDSWAATGRWDIPLCNRWTIIMIDYYIEKCRDYKVIIDDYWWLSSHFWCYCYCTFWRDIYDCIYHLTGFYHHIGLYGILL